MTSRTKDAHRWVMANVRGQGDVCFQTSGTIESGDEYMVVRRVTSVSVSAPAPNAPPQLRIHKLAPYALGLWADDALIYMRREEILIAAAPAKKLTEACDEIWSAIVKPSPGQIHNLGGNNRIQ